MNNLCTGSYNTAIGYNTLIANTSGTDSHALGYGYNPKKYIVLKCSYFQDPIAVTYGFDKKFASLLIYNNVTNKLEYDFISLPTNGLSNINDAYKIYEKIMPKYITLYLSLKQHLHEAHHDICTHLSKYYIDLYYN